MREDIERVLNAMKADYYEWSITRAELTGGFESTSARNRAEESVKNYNEGLTVKENRNYWKIISKKAGGTSVNGFIVKEDETGYRKGKSFKKGDLLMAAGWNAPARNIERGNLYSSNDFVIERSCRWTGIG
jgi:hypothetical protein